MTPPQPRHKAVSRGRHQDSTPPPTVLYSHMSFRVTSSGTKLWRAISRSSINLPADRPRTAIRLPSPPQQFKIPGAGKKKTMQQQSILILARYPSRISSSSFQSVHISHGIFRRARWSQHPKSDKIIAKNIKNMLLSRSIPSLPSTLRRVESGAAKQSKTKSKNKNKSSNINKHKTISSAPNKCFPVSNQNKKLPSTPSFLSAFKNTNNSRYAFWIRCFRHRWRSP